MKYDMTSGDVAKSAFLGSLALGIAYCGWTWLRGKFSRRRGAPTKDVFFQTLFFPDDKVACRTHFTSRHGCTSQRCRFSHDPQCAYAQLLKLLSSSRQSLDLCVYVITCSELADVIVEQHHRGVVVRIITDGEQVEAMGSQIGKFRSEGIQVRLDSSSYLMHHKFALIDDHTLLNGSFNWTRQAITGNQENVLITNQSAIVRPYGEQFELLWQKFGPNKKS